MIHIMEHRRPFLEKWRQWNKFSKYSGGTLVEKCCHYFDLFNVIAGSRPTRVFASGAMNVNFKQFEYEGEKSDIIDGAFVIVEYANGVRSCLELSMFMPRGNREEIRISGSRATLYGTDRPESHLRIVTGGEDMDREVVITAQPHVAATGTHDGSTYYEHLRFYRAIRDNVKPEVSAADGLWAVAIGAAAEQSIKTGMPETVRLEE
jgi:predicted dehydrogenase